MVWCHVASGGLPCGLVVGFHVVPLQSSWHLEFFYESIGVEPMTFGGGGGDLVGPGYQHAHDVPYSVWFNFVI
jgi:hypothetical protein